MFLCFIRRKDARTVNKFGLLSKFFYLLPQQKPGEWLNNSPSCINSYHNLSEFWYPVVAFPLIHCSYVLSEERMLERSTTRANFSTSYITNTFPHPYAYIPSHLQHGTASPSKFDLSSIVWSMSLLTWFCSAGRRAAGWPGRDWTGCGGTWSACLRWQPSPGTGYTPPHISNLYIILNSKNKDECKFGSFPFHGFITGHIYEQWTYM